MATFVKHLFSGRKEKWYPKREAVQRIGIKACGYSVPPHIRYNNDPLFHNIVRMVNAQGIAEVDLLVKDNSTARIQEAHQLLIHVLCEIIEARMEENKV